MSNQNRVAHFFYGSRLFLKFFFWFWATTAITIIIVGLYAYYFHIEPETKRFDKFHFDNMQEAANYMAEAYEKDGAEAAAIFALKGVDWFFDENLNNILKEFSFFPGAIVKNEFFASKKDQSPKTFSFPTFFGGYFKRNPSYKKNSEKDHISFATIHKDKITEFASQIFKGERADSLEIDDFYFQGCLSISSSGKKYVAIRNLPWKSKKRHWYMLRRIFEALPLLILISAPFCLFLGRYTARPVIEISEASRKFASGDLRTRVESSALSRFDEIGDLATDFNKMAGRLEDMINSQKKLLGDISHELRSPLARMQIALEIIEKRSDETDKMMLKRIETEATRLNQLIGKLLELNRIGAQSLKLQTIDLSGLLERVLEDGIFEASAKNVEIDFTKKDQVSISADSYLIEQAIENILRNAIKYSPNGSKISIALEADETKSQAVISILDQGEGLAEEHMAKIFEPFYRCHDDRDRKTGGAGLGLAIAWRAVKAHGGEIVLQNLESGGLSAKIFLPV